MAFPWELNLDHAYRDGKWDLPDELARGRSTDTVFGVATEKLDECPVDSGKWEPTGEHSDPQYSGKRKASSRSLEVP
ncbi:MAG: hypothetical protein V7643_3276 [Mycobacterium sp.]|jgi:hypothetical protein